MSDQTEIFLKRITNDLKSEWTDFVYLAASIKPEDAGNMAEFLSKESGVGKDSIHRKLSAVIYFLGLSHDIQEIISWGQERTLSKFAKGKRSESYEKQVQLRFTLPGSLRELISQDLERISGVLKFNTSEMLFDFLHSLFENLTEEDLRQLAGELPRKK